MITRNQNILELMEFNPKQLSGKEFSNEYALTIWNNYRNQINVEFPSPKTDGNWSLTSQGWVGYIPVTREFGISLQPKTPLQNIFLMLEYAYKLKSFKFLDNIAECKFLEEFYERLANVLAKRVLDRTRKGLYRAYLPRADRLPYVCGRIDVMKAIQAPWQVDLQCHYEDHTADLEENQIIAWTLSRILRSGLCTERSLPSVRRAFRAVQGLISLVPFNPQDCLGRLYNRLNYDYQSLHVLCRFILEQTGPTHEIGDHTMIPFLVDMAKLYELFVAEWLRKNLPESIELKAQERVAIDHQCTIRFVIDLTLIDRNTDKVLCVIDTKYKAPGSPSNEDIFQVVTYAEVKNCIDAILVYPITMERPLDAKIGKINVKSLAFSIDGDIEKAGTDFLEELFLNSNRRNRNEDV